mmetsp:Transcript_14310/g.17680  ORF Transcript_14310/g.17680 Transcript_14310/m.17680 type:complete len:93 (-) Transcript_14310:81-359(-)
MLSSDNTFKSQRVPICVHGIAYAVAILIDVNKIEKFRVKFGMERWSIKHDSFNATKSVAKIVMKPFCHNEYTYIPTKKVTTDAANHVWGGVF